ncbi:MAG TPA: hypothetical protein V6C86_02765 [Oculatellaceae cyanobacterium]
MSLPSNLLEHKATSNVGEPSAPIRSLNEFERRRVLFRHILMTTAVVIITFFFCEFIADFVVFLGKPANSQNPQYDIKAIVANTLWPKDDNVILCGDSLMKQGIFPELLAAKLHRINGHIRVVNLATNAGSQKDAICFLKYIIKRGIKPRLVVFDYEVANTGFTTDEINQEWGQKKSYLFNGVLSRPTEFGKCCEIYASDLSLLIRHRGNLKHFTMDFLSSLPNPQQFKKRTFYDLDDVNDRGTSWSGMSPDHRLSSTQDKSNEHWRISYTSNYCPRSGHFAYNRNAYSYIIQFCQQNQIPLALVWLPHEKSVYNECWYQEPFDASFFRREFESYAKEPFVFPVFLNTLPEDYSMFSDYRHLSTYGCVKATELLADEMMRRTDFKNILFDVRKAMEK